MKKAEISAQHLDHMGHAELLAAVRYDPLTGIFTRRKSAGNAKAGTRIGSHCGKGYLKAKVLGEYVKLHRLAWFYMKGVWPQQEIDHRNQIKDDNRFDNLRDVDTSTNCSNQTGARKNNRVGIQGVHKIKKTGRYRAACSINSVKHHLGVFATAVEAGNAYRAFKEANT